MEASITGMVMSVNSIRRLFGDGDSHQSGDNLRMGNRIREIRLSQRLSLADLAGRIGSTPQQIQRLEAGERRLSQDWLNRLAGALGVTPADLLPLAGEKPEFSKEPREVFQDRRQSEIWRFIDGLSPHGRTVLMGAIRGIMTLASEISEANHSPVKKRAKGGRRGK